MLCAVQMQEEKKGKYASKKTSNHCAKCEEFVCKDCYEFYHIKSNPRKW